MAKKDDKTAEGDGYTYIPEPPTPEVANRIPEILAHWEDSLRWRPLPLEWLCESLLAHRHLPAPWEEVPADDGEA